MRTGTAGQLAVRSIFPADIAAEIGTLDKKGVEAALGAVAERYPDQYRTIAKRLMDLGRITAYRSGGFSFDLDDLAPGRSTLAARARIRERLADALDIADPEARRTAIAAAVDDERDKLTKDLFDESLAENNPFGLQVLSGSRGSPVNLRSLRGFDGAYEDHHGNRIPLPILSNYAEGLPPASYFAGTFGARKGVLDVKACLSGDTRVLMADFSERRIADIEPGMLVFGADTNGRMRPVRVVRRYDNGSRLCWYVRFLNDVTLVATPDHKLLCADGAQRRVADVVGGMLPVRLSGGARTRSDDIATAGEIPTFDLEVDHPDHMFVLANGLIVSNSTADAGYAAKQLIQGNHRLLVTALDDEDDPDNKHVRGLPVRTDDQDNAGALLAVPVGSYARNTQLTPKILAELRRNGVDEILVRSPAVGGPADGGLFARDVGVRERGRLAPLGDFIGHAAGQAVSEKLTQMQLSSKHCLAAGTQVRMADWSVKSIENIRAGDLVLGSDMTGQTRPVRVLETFDNGLRACRTFYFGCCNRTHALLVATAEHKILTVRGGVRSVLRLRDAQSQIAVLMAGRGLMLNGSLPAGTAATYDIHVDHPDHLFVLANGLIVSNSGGVAGAGPVGFPLINQLMQVPEAFRGGAVHAQADGVVGQMRPAPQGGFYADIGGQEHYIAPEQELQVKPGDTVEAGDVLTDGIPNPAQIVKHKGIGEGRRYFVDAIREALRSAGTHVDRRNLEVLSRGLLDHVRVTGLFDDYAPDDVVPYHTIERNWQPRPGAVTVAPSQAVGTYLERPTLHYTIGTRVTKNMLPRLAHFGVSTLTTHKDPPPFEPEMQRAAAAVSTDPDWQVRMLGSGQKGSLLDATHRGAVSDEAGTSFVPAMIRGVDFGKVGPTTGW